MSFDISASAVANFSIICDVNAFVPLGYGSAAFKKIERGVLILSWKCRHFSPEVKHKAKACPAGPAATENLISGAFPAEKPYVQACQPIDCLYAATCILLMQTCSQAPSGPFPPAS
jgi:hypothetical protein